MTRRTVAHRRRYVVRDQRSVRTVLYVTMRARERGNVTLSRDPAHSRNVGARRKRRKGEE